MVAIGEPSKSGAEIVSPGQYMVLYRFSCQVTNSTTAIQIRLNADGADGAKTAVDFSHADAGGIIDGRYKAFTNVTQADIDGGTVTILIEGAAAAGTEDVTFVNSEINIRRIGPAV